VSEETDNPADSHPGCLSLLQPEHIERLARVKPYMPRNARFGNIAMKAIEEQNVVQIAKAFSDSVRFSIYRHLSELNEMRCKNICLETRVGSPTVSHHLMVLSDAGLIESRREGRGVYYRAIRERLEGYIKYLRKIKQLG
jgi:DNA-binding transcriptional ArsR family regulator